MTDIHKMLLRLFQLWRLDDMQQATLLDMIDDDPSIAIVLLQIHAMLRLLYPNHVLRYRWITCSNSKLGGERPIDIMLKGSEEIQKVNRMLRLQLLR